jgi:glyoxylase-like metal-dependent hydrolase (beta-lactamase superfamily II)
VHFDWERLTDSVHRCRLPFLDVTVGLVQGRTGALLVDTGTALTEAAAIDADVHQIAGHRVTHVVLTHKHFDHVLGSGVFTDAEIYCAPQVFDYLTTATGQLLTTPWVTVPTSMRSTARSRPFGRRNMPLTTRSSTSVTFT